MIQDISPKVFDNTYRDLKPQADSKILCYEAKVAGVTGETGPDGDLWFPDYETFCRNTECGEEDFVYLFAIDEQQYFLYKPGIPEWLTKTPISPSLVRENRDRAFACSTGCHLASWYRKHQFCGCCGKPMTHDHALRMLRCEACGNMVFPVLEPAVIVAVTCGDKLLVTRYKGRIYKGIALIAGFIEIGETGEDAVRREVMEEAGLQVSNIRYFGTQPWGIDNNLLLGYFCEADADQPIRVDDDELSEAVWMDRKDIPTELNRQSLTLTMIGAFAKGEEPRT